MRMRTLLLPILAVGTIAACATRLSDSETRERAEHAFREAFARGNPAILARVQQQDEVQALCSLYPYAHPGLPRRLLVPPRRVIRKWLAPPLHSGTFVA